MGGGVAGLCVGLELQRAGAECLILDPSPLGVNASGVAAGMLAPAFESLLDAPSRQRFDLLRDARDLWLEMPVELHRDGALWVTRGNDADAIAARLEEEGASATLVSGDDARRLSPGLGPQVRGAVLACDDWRVETQPALSRLRSAYEAGGGRWLSVRADAVKAHAVSTAEGTLSADVVVICGGTQARTLRSAAPELASLTPIRGELVRFHGGRPLTGPTLRHAGGYIVPGAAGPVAGATMDVGEDDLRPTEASARQAAVAAELVPELRGRSFESAVGVRAATPDGLPLVGVSESGAWLATGFRRNGWTLAPLAARMIAAGLAGADPGRWAQALRLDRSSLT